MHKYSYHGVTRLGVMLVQAVGCLGTVFCIGLAIALAVVPAVRMPQVWAEGTIWTLLCLSSWVLIVGGGISLVVMNSYPTVWTDERGITLSVFLVGRVFVPWPLVVDVGAGSVPFGNTLVRARRITPLHRLYGWLYSRTFYPSFIIGRDIAERDQLLDEIRRHASGHSDR